MEEPKTTSTLAVPFKPVPRSGAEGAFSGKTQKILDEDEFEKGISDIVERDYFPTLELRRRQLELLDAADDPVRLRSFTAKYSAADSPGVGGGRGPWATPGRDERRRNVASNDESGRADVRSESLSTFLHKHTSEDNAAFEEIMHRENEARKRKYAWAFEAERNDQERRKHLALGSASQPLAIAAPTPASTALPSAIAQTSSSTTTATTTATTVSNVASTSSAAPHADTRLVGTSSDETVEGNLALPKRAATSTTLPIAECAAELALPAAALSKADLARREHAKPEGYAYQAQNTLMYVPSGQPSTTQNHMQPRTARVVVPSNTRLPDAELDFDDDATRRQRLASTPAASSVADSALGADTPKMGGYDFVVTPRIAPGVDMTPVMTWGTVEGTPLCLDGSATPSFDRAVLPRAGPEFTVRSMSARDQLAHALDAKTTKKKRDTARATATAASVAAARLGRSAQATAHLTPAQRLAALSPAARVLARRSTPKLASMEHTPSRLSGPRTPIAVSSGRTPSTSSSATPTRSSITSGLLKLKRSSSNM